MPASSARAYLRSPVGSPTPASTSATWVSAVWDSTQADGANETVNSSSRLRGPSAVGYDAAGLIVQNSWGTGWANGGFGRLSWRVVQNDVVEGDTIDGFAAPPPPTPPVVNKPTISVVSTTGTGAATKISYKVSWKGTPGTSGTISSFYAWVQADGHAFGLVKLTSSTATSASFTMSGHLGHPYRIAVRAAAGKVLGAVRYTARFVPKKAKPGATVSA